MEDVSERARRLLRYSNYSKVAAELNVSRATVATWARGNITPFRLRQLEALLLGQQKAAAPDWERLQRTVDAIAEKVGVSSADLAAAAARAAAATEDEQEQPRPADGGASTGQFVPRQAR